MRHLILAAVAHLTIAACVFAQALPATISIDARIVKRELDPFDYCCANWVWTSSTHALRRIFSTPAQYQAFIRFLRDDVSIRTFRYPAGGNVGFFHFGIPASRLIDEMRRSDASAEADDWIEVEEFFTFLHDGDLRTFLQVNTTGWFDEQTNRIVPFLFPEKKELDLAGLSRGADRVEALARWVKENHYETLVRIWEIGNEEYGGYTGRQYAAIAAEMARRIKKVLPDARIVVTNQLGVTNDQWKAIHIDFSRGVLEGLKTEKVDSLIAGVTNHVYAFAVESKDGNVSSSAYQEFASYTSFQPDDPYRHPWARLFDRAGRPASFVAKQADDLDAHGFPNAGIFVTEYRLGGMWEPHNQALANGLGNLQLTAGWAAAPRVAGSTIHSLLHASAVTAKRPFGTWGYDVINYQMDNNLQPRFVSTPVAEAFNLIWRLARGDVLATQTSDPLLFCVATRERDALRLLVINRAAKPENPADITAGNWGGKETAADLAHASEKGDEFHAKIGFPADFTASSYRVFTLGEREKLSDRSVEAGGYAVHEIKVRSSEIQKMTPGQSFECPLAAHSATLIEFWRSP